jgi:hypothetical protein
VPRCRGEVLLLRSEEEVVSYRITLHARHKTRELGLTIAQMGNIIDLNDVCETMPTDTDDRVGKRLYGRLGTKEIHVVLVLNSGDSLLTVTTVYEVDRRDFPDGRTRGSDR